MHYNTKIIKEKLLVSNNDAERISNMEYDFKIMMFKYIINIERRFKAAIVRLFSEYLNVNALHKILDQRFYNRKTDDLKSYLVKHTKEIKTRLNKESVTVEDYIFSIPFSEVFNIIDSLKGEHIKFIQKQFNYNKLSVNKFKTIINKLVKTRNVICHNGVILPLPGVPYTWYGGDYLIEVTHHFLTQNLYRELTMELNTFLNRHGKSYAKYSKYNKKHNKIEF